MPRCERRAHTPPEEILAVDEDDGRDAFEDRTMSFVKWVRLTRGEHDVDISRSDATKGCEPFVDPPARPVGTA